METSAHANNNVLMGILSWTDTMFIDIKHMDSVAHLSGTGAGNELIQRNVEAVASNGWDGRLIIRVPIVPGYNDTVQNLKAIAAFMAKLELE